MYLILGAGPAGLTFANRLLQLGKDSFLVLERETVAGGLCRSVNVDGSPFDIGGGHFLDVRRPKVNEFLFQFMPEEEWNLFDRDSRIEVGDYEIEHPFEANIWQLPEEEQKMYLASIAAAGCNTENPMPEKFVDWIYWKLGDKIASDYMIPYNQKMFGSNLNQLGIYWLEKLPNVSYEETLQSCKEHRAYGKQPGHAQFYYPKKYGYGELWLRMADAIKDHIEYCKKVKRIDFDNRIVYTTDGDNYKSDVIITTIPWMSFEGAPKELVSQLKYSSIQTEYFKENLDTTAHWMYYPNPELSYHRILVRSNFCTNSKGYWTETNSNRIQPTKNFTYLNEYAYPLNTINKPEIMKKLLIWGKEHGVYGLGRWGEHQHYNSDVTTQFALELAKRFI